MNKKYIILPAFLAMAAITSNAQDSTGSKTSVGGYAEAHYHQDISMDEKIPGELDLHRVVLYVGHTFSDKLSFKSELEWEHVFEAEVEQAYFDYKFSDLIGMRAGYVLTPMGIINEYHEPPLFNGVDRPNIDRYIVPTTWRELSAGFFGRLDKLSLKYQAYITNGFISHKEGKTALSGEMGLREGRQEGAESIIHSPNFAAKIDWYGISGLKVGLAGYMGNTQSDVPLSNVSNLKVASQLSYDSTVVGIKMIGVDYRYAINGLETRGEFIYSMLSNTARFNQKDSTDLGSAMMGYYIEAGYNIMPLICMASNQKLALFARIEEYNMHQDVEDSFVTPVNGAYNHRDFVFGASYRPKDNFAYKFDYRLRSDANGEELPSQVNLGVGVYFY